MSKLPIYIQLILAFASLNIVLMVLGQPLLLINEMIDAETKLTITRTVAVVGMLSLATFYISSNSNSKSNA
jgi:hypothetical protein